MHKKEGYALNSVLITLNGIGCLFIIYLITKAIQIHRTKRRCKPIHKQGFKATQPEKRMIFRLHIVSVLCLWGLWIFGITMYATSELILLYLAAILGVTTSYPIFNTGKVGERGVMIADFYIPWQKVNQYSLESLPISDFHYPSANLTLETDDEQTVEFIVDREKVDEINTLVENKLLHGEKTM